MRSKISKSIGNRKRCTWQIDVFSLVKVESNCQCRPWFWIRYLFHRVVWFRKFFQKHSQRFNTTEKQTSSKKSYQTCNRKHIIAQPSKKSLQPHSNYTHSQFKIMRYSVRNPFDTNTQSYSYTLHSHFTHIRHINVKMCSVHTLFLHCVHVFEIKRNFCFNLISIKRTFS